MEEGRGTFKILTGKPTGKRTLGRLRRKLEDNIRMDHKEIGIKMRGIGLIRLRIGINGEPLRMQHSQEHSNNPYPELNQPNSSY